MKVSDTRKFGRADLEVTAFSFGTAPIGNIFREIDEATSDGMIQRAWDEGVRYYDTARCYGMDWQSSGPASRCAGRTATISSCPRRLAASSSRRSVRR